MHDVNRIVTGRVDNRGLSMYRKPRQSWTSSQIVSASTLTCLKTDSVPAVQHLVSVIQAQMRSTTSPMLKTYTITIEQVRQMVNHHNVHSHFHQPGQQPADAATSLFSSAQQTKEHELRMTEVMITQTNVARLPIAQLLKLTVNDMDYNLSNLLTMTWTTLSCN